MFYSFAGVWGFEPRQFQTTYFKIVFAASSLSIWHEGVEENSGRLDRDECPLFECYPVNTLKIRTRGSVQYNIVLSLISHEHVLVIRTKMYAGHKKAIHLHHNLTA